MSIITVIGIILISLVILLLIAGIFIKKDYSVAREVIIDKGKAVVFSYIKFLKNQDNYSVWAAIDPIMKKEYIGIDGTVGFTSVWESDNKDVGAGEQEIKSVSDGEKIIYEIRFLRPFRSISLASMTTISIDDSKTKVRWEFQSTMKYPMNLMLLFMNMEKLIGNDLEKGLSNLNTIFKEMPAY